MIEVVILKNGLEVHRQPLGVEFGDEVCEDFRQSAQKMVRDFREARGYDPLQDGGQAPAND